MTEHQKRAQYLFENGAHCAQAAFAALCDQTGLREEDALALSSCFGGGIGRMRETCGALSGMLMALGMTLGRYDVTAPDTKDRHYRLTQYAALRFRQETGSLFCYELLSIPHAVEIPVSAPRNEHFFKTRPCERVILAAVAIFDELMQAQKDGTLEQLITPACAEQTTRLLNQKNEN